jgi:iron complex transport system permease protein
VQLFADDAAGALARQVVFDLRLPRAMAAFACGGLLAFSGTLMQRLFANPLADPYVLGISGGAGMGALLALSLGLSAFHVDALAFAGALLSIGLVLALSGSFAPTRLLLTGVVVASGFGAINALILSLAPEGRLRGMLFWLMGDLSQADRFWPPLLALAVVFGIALPFLRDLNALAQGAARAQSLGASPRFLGALAIALASLSTALAVTTAGAVGFIGLIAPHLARLLTGADLRRLLPCATLLGGLLLLFADTLSRTLIAPQQLPVGVLTALIGVPAFLFLLRRR